MKQEGENHPQEEEPPLERMEDEALEQGEGEEEELNEDEAAEFSLLNRQLDQLDQALDAIEERNDDIHSKLRELLGSELCCNEENGIIFALFYQYFQRRADRRGKTWRVKAMRK